MKKVLFLFVLTIIFAFPVISQAMTLDDVLTGYYVEKEAPKVLGAATYDGGLTTVGPKTPSLTSDSSLIIIKGLRYSEGSNYIISGQLKKGMTSTEVKKLQLFLIAKGYLDADPTGFYGSLTTKAVKKFQDEKGIVYNGTLVGPATRAAIASDVAKATPDIK